MELKNMYMFLQIRKLYPIIYSDGLDLDKLICSERNMVVVLDNYGMSTSFWDSCNEEILNYALLLPYCSINIEYVHIEHATYEDVYLTNLISVLNNIFLH